MHNTRLLLIIIVIKAISKTGMSRDAEVADNITLNTPEQSEQSVHQQLSRVIQYPQSFPNMQLRPHQEKRFCAPKSRQKSQHFTTSLDSVWVSLSS